MRTGRSAGSFSAVLSIAVVLGVGAATGGVVATVEAAGATPQCHGHQATIVGTTAADHLVGTRRRDVILAGAGGDRIKARGGNDVVCAGPGDDVLLGGAGDDQLYGEQDRFVGGEDYHFLADRLVGGPGADLIVGGDDEFAGEIGHDLVSYAGSSKGVTVNLNTHRGPFGDQVIGIEWIVGSGFDDDLVGCSCTWDGDVIVGLGGDDWLRSPVEGELTGGLGDD